MLRSKGSWGTGCPPYRLYRGYGKLHRGLLLGGAGLRGREDEGRGVDLDCLAPAKCHLEALQVIVVQVQLAVNRMIEVESA